MAGIAFNIATPFLRYWATGKDTLDMHLGGQWRFNDPWGYIAAFDVAHFIRQPFRLYVDTPDAWSYLFYTLLHDERRWNHVVLAQWMNGLFLVWLGITLLGIAWMFCTQKGAWNRLFPMWRRWWYR
jgi:hypothetical protein